MGDNMRFDSNSALVYGDTLASVPNKMVLIT